MFSLIQKFASELAAVVPEETVDISGTWSTSRRKTYENPMQTGSGAGPLVEVVDVRWSGTLACAVPVAGIAFLVTPSEIHWVKSAPPTINPSVSVSMHARAGYTPERASFSAGLQGAFLPAVAFACGEDLIAACTLGQTRIATGRAHLVGEVKGAAFVVLLLPASVLKVGRNRLWRLRDEPLSLLPADLRDLFGRGRTGVLRSA